MAFQNRICVAGMWHLGCVTAGCLAKLGNDVTCFDFSSQAIANLKKKILPVYEPGLEAIFYEMIEKNQLHFSSELNLVIPQSNFIYLAFDTPVNEKDEIDLSPIDLAVDLIIPNLSEDAIVVISSQVPIGTCNKILEKIRQAKKANEICYIPENLRLGNAIDAFMNPERIVFGLSSNKIKEKIDGLFKNIPSKKIFMDLKSAEMTKHAMNAYLATLISFSGEISDLCEEKGADAVSVMNALKSEKRVSPFAPLMPGLGFGGGTLARDLQILRGLGKDSNIKTQVLDAVYLNNIDRQEYIQKKLKSIFGSIDNKKITFFGLTYKAGTNTLRKSLTLQVINQIKKENVTINAYDPLVKEQIKECPHINIFKSVEEAVDGSDMIVIMTDWAEFKNMDYLWLCKKMKTKIVFDTKNILDKNKFKETSIKYYGIGIPHAE